MAVVRVAQGQPLRTGDVNYVMSSGSKEVIKREAFRSDRLEDDKGAEKTEGFAVLSVGGHLPTCLS